MKYFNNLNIPDEAKLMASCNAHMGKKNSFTTSEIMFASVTPGG